MAAFAVLPIVDALISRLRFTRRPIRFPRFKIIASERGRQFDPGYHHAFRALRRIRGHCLAFRH